MRLSTANKRRRNRERRMVFVASTLGLRQLFTGVELYAECRRMVESGASEVTPRRIMVGWDAEGDGVLYAMTCREYGRWKRKRLTGRATDAPEDEIDALVTAALLCRHPRRTIRIPRRRNER